MMVLCARREQRSCLWSKGKKTRRVWALFSFLLAWCGVIGGLDRPALTWVFLEGQVHCELGPPDSSLPPLL